MLELLKLIKNSESELYFQNLGVLFNIRVVDGIPGNNYLSHTVDHPLFVETVDRYVMKVDRYIMKVDRYVSPVTI